MAAHADDLRYWYSETIGDTIEVTPVASTSTPLLTEPLQPGRYMLRVLDFNAADLWVRQGKDGDVEAAATAPSMRFLAHTDAAELNKPLLTFIVRPGSKGGDDDDSDGIDQIAFFTTAAAAVIQVTKYSRDVL